MTVLLITSSPQRVSRSSFLGELVAARLKAQIARSAAESVTSGVDLDIRRLDKRYGDRQVLQGIDLKIRAGEFVAIVGRSGCGKSTLLRLVAGLEAPEGGSIRVAGRPRSGLHDDTRVMFQDPRLLPWKRVLDNVALGLSDRARRSAARAVLEQVGLAERGGDWPAVLSGGQRQRVALARALVHEPRLLLLDEPLGALDALTRIEMQQLIEGLWLQRGFTALLITHDVSEAIALADRVVLIEGHRVALDKPVALPRPRQRGDPRFAELEARILGRVLQPTRFQQTQTAASPTPLEAR